MISQANRQDCLKALKMMPDKSAYIIADPPYYSGPEKRGYYGRLGELRGVKRNDYTPDRKGWKPPTKTFFKELKRVGIHWMVFGANYFPPLIGTPFKAPRHKEFNNFIDCHPYGWIIWDKCNYANKLADCELIYTSFYNMPTVRFRYMWNGMLQGSSIANGHIMQADKSLNEKRIHTTQKPVNLYKWLLHYFIPKGANIVDTHMGSQSLRIAAHELGYNYNGYEINKHNFDQGNKRFAQYLVDYNEKKKQIKLFE